MCCSDTTTMCSVTASPFQVSPLPADPFVEASQPFGDPLRSGWRNLLCLSSGIARRSLIWFVPSPNVRSGLQVDWVHAWLETQQLRTPSCGSLCYRGSGMRTWSSILTRSCHQSTCIEIVSFSATAHSDATGAGANMDDHSWRKASLLIRREHDCALPYTSTFGRNHLLDDCSADYWGITALTSIALYWHHFGSTAVKGTELTRLSFPVQQGVCRSRMPAQRSCQHCWSSLRRLCFADAGGSCVSQEGRFWCGSGYQSDSS